MLDEQGFIKCSRIFDGNVGEPATLIDMISDIHAQVSAETPPLLVTTPEIVMDAGIAPEDNLDMVKENGFSSIVVSRSRPEHRGDGTFEEIQEGIAVKEMHMGDETYLHCLSDGKMNLKSYPKVLERNPSAHCRWRHGAPPLLEYPHTEAGGDI